MRYPIVDLLVIVLLPFLPLLCVQLIEGPAEVLQARQHTLMGQQLSTEQQQSIRQAQQQFIQAQQALMGQQPSTDEGPGSADVRERNRIPNWKRMGPHEIPHCDIPPRAEKDPENVAPCWCPGKVNIVQTLMAEACWAASGILIPEEPEVRKLVMAFPTAEILECLGEVPDHCEVIAGMYNPRMPRLDKLKEHGYTDAFRCATMCKPERCGCPDSACKPHGNGRYQYRPDPTDDDGVPYDEYR